MTDLAIIPRSSWENPAQPIRRSGQAALQLARITTFPAHYTGDQNVPSTNVDQYLRNMQASYLASRGYSIGYNFALDRNGTLWEIRGWDIQCAANKGWNDVTIACLCLVNWQDAMSDLMLDRFRALATEADRRCGRALNRVVHSDIGATRCAGDGITAQRRAGLLNGQPAPDPDPTPTPPDPTPEDDDMGTFLITNPDTGEIAVIYGAGLMTGLPGSAVDAAVCRFGDPLTVDTPTWQDFQGKSRQLAGS